MTLLRLTASLLLLSAATVAHAQTTGAALTPTRDTTAAGHTRPPGRSAGPAARDSGRRSAGDRRQDGIAQGICIGCAP